MNSQPFCSTCRTCQKLLHSTYPFFSYRSVLLKMSTYSFSQRRMLKCCEKIFAPMSIRSLFSEASPTFGWSRLRVSEISSFWTTGTTSLLVVVDLALSTTLSSSGSSLCFFLQLWRKGKGASKPQRWQAAMKLLTLSSYVFLPLVQAQRYSLPICSSLAMGKPYCRLSPALQMGVISVKRSFTSSIEKKPWFSQYFLENARLRVPVILFFEARYSSSIRAIAQSKSQYSTLSKTRKSLSNFARRRERWYSSVKQRQILSSFLADFFSTQVAPSSSTHSKVANLRWIEKKKFWALQSRRQLKPSGFSKSGWQRMTSMSWQKSSALCQYRLQYLRDIMNSSSFTSASLLILCFCRKQKTTNSSNSIPLPMPPAVSSASSAFLCAKMSAISCLVYYHGSTLPASLSFDMFSRKASKVGVSAQGLSACLAWLKFQCGCDRSFSFSWSIRWLCAEDPTLTAEASASWNGSKSVEEVLKIAPA